MKKNGFTLIELLAVILILGIIALIAIPTVATIISDSKEQAFLVTTRQIADAISDQCNMNALKGIEDTGTYSIIDGKLTYDVGLKGKLPISGKININDKCEVEILGYNDNVCAYKGYNSDKAIIGNIANDNCQINSVDVEMDTLANNISCFTFDSSTGTITDYDINNPICQGAVVVPEKINGINVTDIAQGAFIADYKYLVQKAYPNGNPQYDFFSENSTLVPYDIYPLSDLPVGMTKTCYVSYEETNGVTLPYDGDASGYDWCKFNDFTLDNTKIVTTTGINSIDFSKAVHLKSIGAAVSTRSTLTKVKFGNLPELTYLGPNAFDNNNISGTVDFSGLTALTSIRTNLFNNNNITEVIFNDKINVIWHYAFNNNSITSLNLPDSLEAILLQVFAFNDIKNLVIPDKVSQIDMYAFYENLNMDTVTFGSGIKYIDKQAFYNCGINSVDFSKSSIIINLGEQAFTSNKIKNLDVNAQYYYLEVFTNNLLESVHIGSRIKGVNRYSFANNPTLKNITIDSSYSSNSPWGAPSTCTVTHTS